MSSVSADAVADLEDVARRVYARAGRESTLAREATVDYLFDGLRQLPAAFTSLDASRAWMVYWCVHGLALLDVDVASRDEALARDVVRFLRACRRRRGRRACFGFGGGPGQMPHVATTYAATCALVTIGTEEARETLVKEDVRAFLMSLKDETTGGFRVHDGGETDARGCYAALATAHLCGVLDDELTRGVGAFVARCQSYEGGIAGEPLGEAHGGYTFCGLAACALAGSLDALDLGNLERWLANRQGEIEGGFNGRTNKLVDGCYSFWQGGCFPVLQRSSETLLRQFSNRSAKALKVDADGAVDFDDSSRAIGVCAATLYQPAEYPPGSPSPAPFANGALQGWILDCCQSDNGAGGLRDKPGVGRDHYHTCYCLSGLSLAQHYGRCGVVEVVGPLESNTLAKVDPVVNVVQSKYDAWMSKQI